MSRDSQSLFQLPVGGVGTTPDAARPTTAGPSPAPNRSTSDGQDADSPPLVAQSELLRQTLRRADRFAGSDANVLLVGESGTGKEVVARRIHQHSRRAGRPYVRVNCAALSESLIESELFGHCRGAFTGAEQPRQGRLEWAADGTLLLDEIGELPLTLQAKLLRVLEEGEFQRVGDNQTQQLKARIVAATNRDLRTEVAAGRFRADLFYRIHVLHLEIPPLRARPDDILPLAQHFLRQVADDHLELSRRAAAQLLQHDWPGNARELRNVIQRAAVLCEGRRIEQLELLELEPLPVGEQPQCWPDVTLAEAERQLVQAALTRCAGDRSAAAQRLGVSARVLASKLRAA